MKRREFLMGVAAVAAAPVVPRILEPEPQVFIGVDVASAEPASTAVIAYIDRASGFQIGDVIRVIFAGSESLTPGEVVPADMFYTIAGTSDGRMAIVGDLDEFMEALGG